MRVYGMKSPGQFTVEKIPGTNRSLIRLFQNIKPCYDEDFDGFVYDEYHVEVETWDGIDQNVRDNYDVFLSAAKAAEAPPETERLRADTDFLLIMGGWQ